MKKTWLLPILLLACFQLYGQKYKTIELKPITKQGWNYYYDLKKVKSPYTLQFPLMGVEDEEIDRLYKGFQTMNTLSTITSFIPIIYIITLPKGAIDQETFWTLWGASLATVFIFQGLGHSKLGKAIDRYNLLIYQPSGQSFGASLSVRF